MSPSLQGGAAVPRREGGLPALPTATDELELLDRDRRSTERRIRQAKFPVVKTLDTFDLLAIPSTNKTLVLDLARCEFLSRNEKHLLRFQKLLASYEILIVDELGFVPLSKTGGFRVQLGCRLQIEPLIKHLRDSNRAFLPLRAAGGQSNAK